MTQALKRILLVEDDEIDQLAFKRLIKSQNLPYDYTIATSVAETRQILTNGQPFDVIILDYHLGDGTAFDLLETLTTINTPLIFATGTGDEEIAVKALKSGAYDYLIKDPHRNYLKVLDATIENALRRQQTDQQLRMLSMAVMSTTDSVFITDMSGQIIFVNKAFNQTYGYTADEIIGRSPDILYTQRAGIDHTSQDLLIPMEASEFYHKRKDGAQFPVSVSCSIVKDEHGQGTAIVAVARDISESKRVEQELRDLNASKDKFFSIISHDLRSPFTHILGYSEVLSDEVDSLEVEQIKSFAKIIYRATKQLSNLLENLLHWSGVQTGRLERNPQQLDLAKIVTHNITLLQGNATHKNIQLSDNIPDAIAIYADKNTTNSVMQNLISNAIKFTPSGGKVTVTATPQKKHVEIAVSDTGVGMSQQAISKLFRIDTHHSTLGTDEEKGSGLGLILCKEFVEQNNGKIWVESEPGQGTTFRFTLPMP